MPCLGHSPVLWRVHTSVFLSTVNNRQTPGGSTAHHGHPEWRPTQGHYEDVGGAVLVRQSGGPA
jgi:hypothetical protein